MKLDLTVSSIQEVQVSFFIATDEVPGAVSAVPVAMNKPFAF